MVLRVLGGRRAPAPPVPVPTNPCEVPREHPAGRTSPAAGGVPCALPSQGTGLRWHGTPRAVGSGSPALLPPGRGSQPVSVLSSGGWTDGEMDRRTGAAGQAEARWVWGCSTGSGCEGGSGGSGRASAGQGCQVCRGCPWCQGSCRDPPASPGMLQALLGLGGTARGTAVLRDPHGSPWHQAAPLMLGAASPWLLCLWGDMDEGAGVSISWVTQPAAPHPEQQPLSQTGRSSSRSWDPCCGEAGGRGALLPPCCPSSWRDDPKSQGRSRAQGKRVSGSCCPLCQHGWASPPP